MRSKPLFGWTQQGKWIAWVVSLAFLALPLNGLLCRVEEGDKRAMACCRGDGARCNMPDKKEDCCKGQTSTDNPLTASLVSVAKQAPPAPTATLPASPSALPLGGSFQEAPFPLKFPLASPNAPLTRPLRI